MVSLERTWANNNDIKPLSCVIFHADSNDITLKPFSVVITCKTVCQAKIASSRMRRPRAKRIKFLQSAYPNWSRT